MNKRDIFKLIFISLIICCSIVFGLLVFSRDYILRNTTVAKSNIEELSTNEYDVEEKDESTLSEDEVDKIEDEIIQNEVPIITEEIEYLPDVYYIKVNNQMNTVTIYKQDEFGKYTIPIKAMVCSIGEVTPKNSMYKLTSKRWQWRALFGNVYGQYATHINGDILFHSVPYTEPKNNTLEYWEYDKLGTVASAGCVRLIVKDAKWIYDNCLPGSIVEFYSSEDPGPLGKPRVEKISSNIECRDWDPTDLNPNNPWNNV